MLEAIQNRIQDLETAVAASRGRQAQAEETLADETAGFHQMEGRLLEARDQYEVADEAGLEESITGLTRQVADLRGRLTPKALEAYDNEGADDDG